MALWLLGAMVMSLAFSGCVSERNGSKRVAPVVDGSGAIIDELNLLAVPVALNFDQLPGLDGFVLKVYPGNRSRPKPVPIEKGKLDILMYEGILTDEQRSLQPRQIWSFTVAQLKRAEVRTSIGTGYELKPEWGEAKPRTDRITVVARYVSPEGRATYSAPSVISVSGK